MECVEVAGPVHIEPAAEPELVFLLSFLGTKVIEKGLDVLLHLVAKFLGTTLEKGSQKADWARRPLTLRMETYARNDTHYLQPLAAKKSNA